MKDRKSSEKQILEALDRLIYKEGFKSLGVNSVAKEANLSKILIYRYFNGFEGLLETWALKNSFWTNGSVELKEESTALENAKSVLSAYSKNLRKDRIKREILRWFLIEKTSVGTKVMSKLEESGINNTKEFKKILKDDNDLDIEALVSILTAGISYLALLSDRAEYYNGVNIKSDEGWNRLEGTIEEIIKRLID